MNVYGLASLEGIVQGDPKFVYKVYDLLFTITTGSASIERYNSKKRICDSIVGMTANSDKVDCKGNLYFLVQ